MGIPRVRRDSGRLAVPSCAYCACPASRPRPAPPPRRSRLPAPIPRSGGRPFHDAWFSPNRGSPGSRPGTRDDLRPTKGAPRLWRAIEGRVWWNAPSGASARLYDSAALSGSLTAGFAAALHELIRRAGPPEPRALGKEAVLACAAYGVTAHDWPSYRTRAGRGPRAAARFLPS
jgi:hypothetical protein